MNAIIKLQPPSNKKKIQELLGMLNFLSKNVYKLQLFKETSPIYIHLGIATFFGKHHLYLRPSYYILREQNNFEWITEHQKQFEETKTLLNKQITNTIPDSDQLIHAMCDASNFGTGVASLQSHSGTNKMNLFSANSKLLTEAELRLSTLMRECTVIIYTLTEYEF